MKTMGVAHGFIQLKRVHGSHDPSRIDVYAAARQGLNVQTLILEARIIRART